jgi:hypothetical protein
MDEKPNPYCLPMTESHWHRRRHHARPFQFGLGSLFGATTAVAFAAWLIPIELAFVLAVALAPFVVFAICWPRSVPPATQP